MIDLRRVVVAFMLVAIAGAAAAQDHPGRGGGDRPNRQEQSQQGGPTTSRAAPAFFRCCRAMRSASTASTRRAASSPIRRPPERSRCSINRASVRPRCSTPPMWPKDRQSRRAAADLRLQWRARRGFGVPPSRGGGSAPGPIRHGRPRRRRRPPGRQSGHLACLHRSGADRSGRHRLEPAGQARRRQRVLGRARRRRARWRRSLRFTSPRTAASVRRNSSSAKATAAFAPPRSRAPCRASRAS